MAETDNDSKEGLCNANKVEKARRVFTEREFRSMRMKGIGGRDEEKVRRDIREYPVP